MDIGKSFSFIFEDEKWVAKVLIGGLIALIPIVNFAVYGYVLKIAQNVAQGNPRPLPEWGDFGDHFMRGLHAFVIILVYEIPFIILYGLSICITIGAGASSQDANSANAMLGLLNCILMPLMLIVGLVTAALLGPAFGRYVATNSLGDALKIGEVFAMLRNRPGPWLMLLLIGILAQTVGSLGLLACFVGILFTAPIGYYAMGHALGQTVAKEGMVSGGYSEVPPPYTPPTYQ